jgi:hypothetical protein
VIKLRQLPAWRNPVKKSKFGSTFKIWAKDGRSRIELFLYDLETIEKLGDFDFNMLERAQAESEELRKHLGYLEKKLKR